MLNELKNYILENKFKINITENNIDIINYKDLDHFDDKTVIIRKDKGYVIVKGEKLVIAKLLQDEVLISGIVRNIQFNDWNS